MWWLAIVIPVVIIIIIVVAIVGWWISTLNAMRRMVIKIDEAESGIDVALTKRFDLLTKALDTVKGYAKHEYQTLKDVIGARGPNKGDSMEDKSEMANKMATVSREINIVMEQYPNLKADAQFSRLQSNISETEEHLQAARRLYNSNVSVYNQKIVVFPSNIIAKRYGFTARKFFEADEAKRADVKMDFGF